MKTAKNSINIFTDGACSNNPGKGGAAALLRYNDHQKQIVGFLPLTTNNQMELIACILALSALKRPCNVTIFTDSTYVKNGITQWINKWQQYNWIKPNKKPVKNAYLWKQLLDLTKPHNISWEWVKGHSGHKENTIVDNLAKTAIIQQSPLLEDYLFLSEELGYNT